MARPKIYRCKISVNLSLIFLGPQPRDVNVQHLIALDYALRHSGDQKDILMKALKILTIAALSGSSLTPTVIAPAFAITASSTTTNTMTSTCAADIASYASAVLHDGTPSFTTQVDETGYVDGTPTEVAGTRVETPGTRIGTGSATYTGLSIAGNPYRTGGSVNLFGDQVATQKNWSNSEYDYTAQFATVTTFSYECQVTQQTETYHPAVTIPGRPALGSYIVDPALIGAPQYNAQLQACNAFNAQAPVAPDYSAPGFWGNPTQGPCVFEEISPAVDPVNEPEYWTPNAPIDRVDLLTTHTVDETNFATNSGRELNGGPWTQAGSWFVSKVVVCNSPLKLPGTWRPQNGYVGTKCTTTYFYSAPWGGGSQTSNGTYISVPGV